MIAALFRRRRPRRQPSWLYVWADGVIALDACRPPDDAVALFRFEDPLAAAVARAIVGAVSRREGEAMFVPGVAEAPNDMGRIDRLIAWALLLEPLLVSRIPAARITCFVRPVDHAECVA